MKKYLIILLALCMVCSMFAGCGSNEPASTPAAAPGDAVSTPDGGDNAVEWKKLNLSFATFQPETAVGNKNIYLLEEKINERMDGAITFDYYYSGTLCSNVDTLDAVISGVADIGYITIGNYPGRLALTSLFDQCGIVWNNTTAASSAMKEFIETMQPEELDEVVCLLYSVSTPGSIASVEPLRTFEDLKGVSMRSTSTTTAAVEAMGAVPMTIEWSECYEALRNGMVDALYTIPGACASSLIQEVAPYATINPFYTTSYMYVMNKDVYESMPAEQQALFMELINEVQAEYTNYYAGNFDGDEKAQNYFHEIEELIFLEDEDLEKLEGAVGHLIDNYATELDAKGVDGTGALAFIRELADKYNEIYPAEDYNEYLKSFLD